MSCVVRWWDVLFVKGMHFSSKNARLLNFWSFQTNNTIFTTNECEKCHVHPVSGAGIQTHDLWNVSLLP